MPIYDLECLSCATLHQLRCSYLVKDNMISEYICNLCSSKVKQVILESSKLYKTDAICNHIYPKDPS